MAGRERHLIVVADQAAENDEAGLLKPLFRHQHMRAEAEAAGDAIGLVVEYGGDAEALRADAHGIADFKPQPVE